MWGGLAQPKHGHIREAAGQWHLDCVTVHTTTFVKRQHQNQALPSASFVLYSPVSSPLSAPRCSARSTGCLFFCCAALPPQINKGVGDSLELRTCCLLIESKMKVEPSGHYTSSARAVIQNETSSTRSMASKPVSQSYLKMHVVSQVAFFTRRARWWWWSVCACVWEREREREQERERERECWRSNLSHSMLFANH